LTFQSLAVGVDLGAQRSQPTPGSRRALERARIWAARTGASVRVVHSSAPDEHWDPEGGWVFADGDRPEGFAALESLVAEFRADGIDAHLEMTVHRPEEALSRLALAGEADLVVVGKRSVPGLDGRRLGSVARKLVHACPSAVWVVAPDAPDALARVLAATELEEGNDSVLRAAAVVVQATGASLHVVHALQVPLSAQMGGAEREVLSRRAVAAEKEILSRLGAAGLDARPELHIGADAPTHAILAGAEKLSPDLVVLGSVGRSGLAGLLVGNTAERILPLLDASLLVVKPPGFVPPLADPGS
jgi:universal stress protein E